MCRFLAIRFTNVFLTNFQTFIFFAPKSREVTSQNRLYLIFCPNQIFLSPDDVELMSGESCHVSCRYRLGFRSYSEKKSRGRRDKPPQAVKVKARTSPHQSALFQPCLRPFERVTARSVQSKPPPAAAGGAFDGPGGARTVANRAGTALTGAVRTGLNRAREGGRLAIKVKIIRENRIRHGCGCIKMA